MAHAVAYKNGDFVSADKIVIPATDAGFMLGVTVAEQLRTFAGKVFQLDQHLARLGQSLETVGVKSPVALDQLANDGEELAARNHALLQSGDDLGLTVFVTPGTYGTYAEDGDSGPLVCMHTFPLPFSQWSETYEAGQALVIPEVRQVPAACWPLDLKCRSRMQYYLADQEARRVDPHARALLLDVDGYITEASTASLLLYRKGEGLLVPPSESILPGISLAFLMQLAEEQGISIKERRLLPDDVLQADEGLLCSTSPCVLPVSSCDGKKLGESCPGPIFRQLIKAWSERVGVDVMAQAERFATRCV